VTLRTVLVVVLALVFGGSAAVGINALRNQESGPPTETVPILVAAAVPSFTLLTADMVQARDFPKAFVPPDAPMRIEDALDRAVLNPLVKGEVVANTKLAPRGAGRGMAAKLRKGMRAFTIQTPTVEAGVAGFILPGSKVDVLLTLDGRGDQDPTGGGSTITLLQNVEILAVEQRVVAPAESKVDLKDLKSVTLAVTPQEAARLTLGQNKGKLCLSLRPLNDDSQTVTRPVHVSQLLGELPGAQPKEAPRPQPADPPAPVRIRTIRGTNEGEVVFAPPATAARPSAPVARPSRPAAQPDVQEILRKAMQAAEEWRKAMQGVTLPHPCSCPREGRP
jgi:pilus assembly protein CpaB